MLWPALFAVFALSFTFSWDEFLIAYLLTQFDVTLPVELWSLLRRGLNPEANAAGTVVFGISIGLMVVLQVIFLVRHRRRRQSPAS